MIQSNSHIRECLRLIEVKWQRGSSSEWNSYDFEKLNTAIYDATGVSLSVSTLKRLFGKVSYPNLPAIHTLNTLARFAGFEDWNAFKRHADTSEPSTPPESAGPPLPTTPSSPAAAAPPLHHPTPQPGPPLNPPPPRRHPLTRWWPLLILPFAFLGYSLLNSKKNGPPAPVDPNRYSFSTNKIMSEGVPNSVVFHYHAQAAPTDSVFIVQSWDMRRKTAVPANGSEYSSIYYYPGFFNAKLVVDTRIVRTQDLMISTDGWLALAEADPIPLYFTKEEVCEKEGIAVDSATLNRYHLAQSSIPPKIRLFYMKDMGHLSDADFSFETTLKNGFNQGSGVCQYVEVLIQCKDDVFIIPLAARACIGNLQGYAAGKYFASKDADLSGFGCDLTQWTTLKVTSSHRQVRFLVNGRQAYALEFPHSPTDIVGIQYRFTGVCAVKNARFTAGDGRTINLLPSPHGPTSSPTTHATQGRP